MQEQMKKTNNRKRINVDELLGTIDAIKEQPELAKFQLGQATNG